MGARRFTRKQTKRRWPGLVLAAALMLCALALLVVFGEGGRLVPGPCAPGREGAAGEASGQARELLERPNFEASRKAMADLEAGVVDERLMAALLAVTEEHRVCVDAFKEGHYFLPGVEDGPLIPEGYGEAGGLPNTHYYGRAADVRRVDGKPVGGNGADPEVLGVGGVLAGIPARSRPDQIIGPADWAEALGRSEAEGWILAPDQLELHEDHLHIGYASDDETRNTR